MTEVIMEYRKLKGQKKYNLPLFVKAQQNVEQIFSADMQIWYMNVESNSNSIIIYLHGGAYVEEILAFHWLMLDKITSLVDSTFIIPDYPLAPYSSYEECYDKMTVLYEKVLKYYQDKQIILMGDSAGGGLALGLCQYWNTLKLRQPDKLILMSPWVDLTMSNPDMDSFKPFDPTLKKDELLIDAMYWAKGTPLNDYRLSPIYGDMSVYKEVHMFTGTHEIFFPDINKMHQQLLSCGIKSELIIGEGLNHVYPAFPIPESNEAINHISEIIKETQNDD